jgi:hydroxymethylpyrimidine pyrophosphatase-like HAD family hydrolase
MGNSPDSLKAVADHVVPDVEHNGVAVAIEKYIL